MNPPPHRAPHHLPQYRYPAPHQPPTPRPSMSVGRVLAIAAGVLLGLLLLAGLAGGGSSSDGDGYDVPPATGGETQFYDGGSITTDGEGGIIVSGTDGTSFSTS